MTNFGWCKTKEFPRDIVTFATTKKSMMNQDLLRRKIIETAAKCFLKYGIKVPLWI